MLWGVRFRQMLIKLFLWYEKGAKEDDPACQYHLGICYHQGIGTSVSVERALEYLYRAYGGGYTSAMEYVRENMGIEIG